MRITLNALRKYVEESAKIAENCEYAFRVSNKPDYKKYADEYHGEKIAYELLLGILEGRYDFAELYNIVVNKKYL